MNGNKRFYKVKGKKAFSFGDKVRYWALYRCLLKLNSRIFLKFNKERVKKLTNALSAVVTTKLISYSVLHKNYHTVPPCNFHLFDKLQHFNQVPKNRYPN